MKRKIAMLGLLADGRFHSGEELGAALGVSRGAVWKALRSLSDLDVEIYAVRGRGYRLAAPLELLDADRIMASMDGHARTRVAQIDVLPEVDSTNRYLMSNIQQGPARACLAERQTAGRGRRGRTWVSPFAGNIYLSLLWRFHSRPSALESVSLAVGVAVVRALRHMGVSGLGLKWPNDILWRGRKLAGILLEMAGEADGTVHLVIGIGVNVRMSAVAAKNIDQPWVDLGQALEGQSVSRNVLAASLLTHLVQVLDEFAQSGLASLRDEWDAHDVVNGKSIELHLPDKVIKGVVRGIDSSGALLLAEGGALRRFYSGEVSLRLEHGVAES